MSSPFENEQTEAAAPGSEMPGKVLPELEEQLTVARVTVDRGGYRIVKHVETREALVEDTTTIETVDIERRPIGRELAIGELPVPRQEGEVWIVPVIEEVVVVEKRRVLREEVRITRKRETRPVSENVTLRKETIEVERLAPHSSVKDSNQ